MVHLNDSTYVSPVQKKRDAQEIISKADDRLYNTQERFRSKYDVVINKIKTNFELKKSLLNCVENNFVKPSSNIYFDDTMGCSFRQKSDYKFGEFLGVFGHDIRNQAAMEYLEDARDYAVEVRGMCAKINDRYEKLKYIEEKINVEEKLLNVLQNNINAKNAESKKQMAQSIKKLLNMVICDNDGNLKQDYITELEKLNKFV